MLHKLLQTYQGQRDPVRFHREVRKKLFYFECRHGWAQVGYGMSHYLSINYLPRTHRHVVLTSNETLQRFLRAFSP